jgi:hydroxypyruvate reductase
LAAGRHLAGHDAYPLFAAIGDLLLTGASGTNVMDLTLALIEPG